ncbi:hypothetical protein DUT90_05585 [Polaribacter sp. WD7]|uniref:hypothetical protein n=1 Tax=Polaribacter sp. WD7 TaxID=2269061 RepID=UPI000DF20651|nr:hypothetical protein [Polaribacter sp. WD7]RCS27584.1 hypothetical protein DUT90_05585 [Polaribacter sp. WD7]
MRTSISTKSILRSSILFFSITAFILSTLLLTSCSESEPVDSLETELALSDQALIAEIETAAKVTVTASDLPIAAANAFSGDLSDTYIKSVQVAEGLGFKVTLGTDDESREENTSEAFLSREGRKLKDNDERRKKRRAQCFQFVFPIDFIMPDDSSITLESKEDWSLIREWYAANPDAEERPTLVFPLDVTLEDGTVQTLIDRDELKAVKDSCKKGKDKRKCFRLVLPVTFTMPDATEITVTERKEFRLIRRWKKANPEVEEKPTLNFPVDIMYKDETTATINSAEEMATAKESCEE